jgi:hypothetical protein
MQTPWWRSDEYDVNIPYPMSFENFSGPAGPMLVRVHPNGTTERGWGEKSFGKWYTEDGYPGKLSVPQQRYAMSVGFRYGALDFAIVMRSMQMICIDIDGKNGGFEGVKNLGMLPPTAAETSKSGNGYHLFYLTTDDVWDPMLGYTKYRDRIGIEQGVDIRGLGCVYHTTPQRWNMRPVVELPQYHKDLLMKKNEEMKQQIEEIQNILNKGDTETLLMTQESLKSDLKKPIPVGRRNNTLYAIGSQMCLLKVPSWDVLVAERALGAGLDDSEVRKLLANIRKYAGSA